MREPGMIPGASVSGPIWGRLTAMCAVGLLSAASVLGEDGAARSASEKKRAEPAKTAGVSEKSAASGGSSEKDKKPAGGSSGRTVPRLAAAEKGTTSRVARKPVRTTPETPIERAIRLIDECRDRYESVNDYTCTFWKRERISGKLIPAHIMSMKVRTKPQSIYLKFQQPAKGREAIYVAGRHGGKVLAHDVGFNKLIAGTLQLEPTSARAMEDCRHPITEAGIGPLLETVARRWALELNHSESIVSFQDMNVGDQLCLMIDTTHPERGGDFMFHKVRLYIDKEKGLPVRFEAYDWPKHPGAEPELAEEYTYDDLKLNVGLKDLDFDVGNGSYSFGRF